MNKHKLKKEGTKWVENKLITEDQLHAILATYKQRNHSYLLILFAALLVSLGVLIFVLSDWAQVPNLIRISVMLLSMIVLYGFGDYFYKKSTAATETYPYFLGVSFLLLGYVFFGATLLLIIHMYNVVLLSVWPYTIWGLIGLLLYVMYPHVLIYITGLVITMFGQIYSGMALHHFDIFIFAVFLIGYTFIAYKHHQKLTSYVLAIGFVIQSLIATWMFTDSYYWFMLYIFILYVASYLMPKHKQALETSFFYISIYTIFIFKMFETFILQDDYFFQNVIFEPVFFILLGISWVTTASYIFYQQDYARLIDISLFIPFFFLPFGYMYVIVSMFLFSLFYVVKGYQTQINKTMITGIVTFLLSTLTVYVQFAWETLNKSLFFIIGGLLLFGLSYLLEKLRRKREQGDGQ